MGKIKETKEGWNMDIFDFLTMLGGLSLFLFGMSLMGSALERRARAAGCARCSTR